MMIGASDLIAEAKITYRELDYWCRNGALVAANEGEGSGRDRLFTPNEVGVAKTMKRLRNGGLDLAHAAAVARQIGDPVRPEAATLGSGVYLVITSLPKPRPDGRLGSVDVE